MTYLHQNNILVYVTLLAHMHLYKLTTQISISNSNYQRTFVTHVKRRAALELGYVSLPTNEHPSLDSIDSLSLLHNNNKHHDVPHISHPLIPHNQKSVEHNITSNDHHIVYSTKHPKDGQSHAILPKKTTHHTLVPIVRVQHSHTVVAGDGDQAKHASNHVIAVVLLAGQKTGHSPAAGGWGAGITHGGHGAGHGWWLGSSGLI